METETPLVLDDLMLVIEGLVDDQKEVKEAWITAPVARRFHLVNLPDDEGPASPDEHHKYTELFNTYGAEFPETEVLNMLQNWSTKYTGRAPIFKEEKLNGNTRVIASVQFRDGRLYEEKSVYLHDPRNARRYAALLLLLRLRDKGEDVMRFRRLTHEERRERDLERERERERERTRGERDYERDRGRESDRIRPVVDTPSKIEVRLANSIQELQYYITKYRAGANSDIKWKVRDVAAKDKNGHVTKYIQALLEIPMLKGMKPEDLTVQGPLRRDVTAACQSAALLMFVKLKEAGYCTSVKIPETTLNAAQVNVAFDAVNLVYSDWEEYVDGRQKTKSDNKPESPERYRRGRSRSPSRDDTRHNGPSQTRSYIRTESNERSRIQQRSPVRTSPPRGRSRSRSRSRTRYTSKSPAREDRYYKTPDKRKEPEHTSDDYESTRKRRKLREEY